MSENDWLWKLKVGDTVLVYRGPGRWMALYSKEIVLRVTKAQIILEGDRRYWKKDGNSVGARWFLQEPTPELLKEMADAERRRHVLVEVNKIIWRDLDTPTLEKILELVKEVGNG